MNAGTPRPSAGAYGAAGLGSAERIAPRGEEGDLRAEHDRLAEQLAARRSIDLVRRGAYVGFAGFIASGLAVKLGYDRWVSTRVTRFRGPPIFFFTALALAAVLVTAALLLFLRARRHMREEDAQFARMQELRRRLELDP
jgi:hypothetical protein